MTDDFEALSATLLQLEQELQFDTFSNDDALELGMRLVRAVREPGPRFQVHGTVGSFIKHGLDSQEDALLRGERPGHPRWGRDDPARHGRIVFDANGLEVDGCVASALGSYEAFYRGVHAAIADGAPLPVTADEALAVIRVIACALRSHAEQRTVPFAGSGARR